MKTLIDADTVAFACAASAEEQESFAAIARAHEMVERILLATEATEYELWLSGPVNYRYKVYPEYKANRIGGYRPKWEKATKEYLIDQWGAMWSDGCEADDMVGIKQCAAEPYMSCIAHIDKDINMIPGLHYNWELTRKGKIVREAKFYEINDAEALRFFYYQLIVGDKGTDNIPGVRGYGPKKAEAILAQCSTEAAMFQAVSDLYSSYEEMSMNAVCLWIQRQPHEDIRERWKKLGMD